MADELAVRGQSESQSAPIMALGQSGLINNETQDKMLEAAGSLAKKIKKIVQDCGLSVKIGQGEHVRFEGWATMTRLMGENIHSEVMEIYKDANENEVIKARGWMTDALGNTIDQAHGFVSTDEPNWKSKPLYARASMAQTRAAAKAMRKRHSWIMVMTGYSGTPAEEMNGDLIDQSPVSSERSYPHASPSSKQLNMWKMLVKNLNIQPEQGKGFLALAFPEKQWINGEPSSSQLTKKEMSKAIELLKNVQDGKAEIDAAGRYTENTLAE